MLRKGLIIAAISSFLGINALATEVIVRVAPPRPIIERRIAPPSHRHVWVSGYHNWNGRSYVWVPGHYEMAPRPRARWVPHHWVRRHGGWVLVEGHWR